MKQRPNNLVAMIIIAALAVLLPLSVLISDSNRTDEGKVLGIFKSKTKKKTNKTKKIKKTETKKTEQKKTSPKTSPKSSSPSPSSSPARGEEKNAELELQSLEREITVLYNDGKVIGPDHYKRLKSRLDALASSADSAKIAKLREMLETINPAQVTSTNPYPSPQDAPCLSQEKFIFTADITDLSRISQISPPGFLNSRGELKTHSFLWIKDNGEVPVYSPMDAKLVAGAYYTEDGINQYILYFEISCNKEFKFDHIRNPIEAIRKALSSTPKTDTRGDTLTAPISFKAGDLIGYTPGTPQAHNWDFGAYDRSQKNLYANDPRAYGNDVYAVCPYDFFTPEKKSRYTSLFASTGELCK